MSHTLVIGANGTVGAELVPLLRADGQRVVKATSRSVADPVSEVHLNVVSGAGLETAFKGADQLFVLAPPGYTNQDELINPVIDAAKTNGVKKVVLMSAMGANADDNAPLRKAELYLERSGLTYNIIRPNWFMQNFNTFWIQGILEQGKIFLPVGSAKGSFIDARDIAAVAARLLTTDEFNNRDFDLTGGVALDHDEVARILSHATGKTITYQDIPEDAMRGALLQAGLPPAYAEFLLVILGYFKAGYSERTTDVVETIVGRPPITLHQYAIDYKSSWLKT